MEKELHKQKIAAGVARAAEQGRCSGRPQTVSDEAVRAAIPYGTTRGAEIAKLSKSQFIRRRRRIEDGEEAGRE